MSGSFRFLAVEFVDLRRRVLVSVTSHPAVLFDIDGTLVDSNFAHVQAWARAFFDAGVSVDAWRIHRSIGMDGSKLVESLAPDADDEQRDRADELQSRYYKESTQYLRVISGARELLAEIASRDLQVVLATSAPEDELSILRELLGIDDIVSAVTSSADVETAKPSPHIVDIALERAGVAADDAVFVGDTVWDVEAAARAGVGCIGVLSGGVSRAELDDAGALAVYTDASELLAAFESSPIARLG